MLTWARNYSDVTSWRRAEKPKGARGPRWLVTLSRQATTSGLRPGGLMGARPLDVVPLTLALTNREVVLLCYGLAVGGERPEPRSAQRTEWGWDEVDGAPATSAALVKQ